MLRHVTIEHSWQTWLYGNDTRFRRYNLSTRCYFSWVAIPALYNEFLEQLQANIKSADNGPLCKHHKLVVITSHGAILCLIQFTTVHPHGSWKAPTGLTALTQEPAKGLAEDTLKKLRTHVASNITDKKCPSLAECRRLITTVNISNKTAKQVSHFILIIVH